METTTDLHATGGGAGHAAPRPARGVALTLFSSASMPLGQSVGSQAFDALTPAGVVAGRQLVTAAVLVPVARPDFRRLTWSQWWPALLLGTVFVAMNLALAASIDRIGVALAVTLEFLGPLGVALVGSRRAVDGLCVLGAAAGVLLLVQPGPQSDFLGVGLALLAATGWAGYILVNRTVGSRLPGLQGTAVAASVATLICLPVLLWAVLTGRFTPVAVVLVLGAGLLSSLVPYACDLLALREIPPRLFGVLASLNPVFAAAAGVLLLSESLSPLQLAGVGAIVLANVVAVVGSTRRAAPGVPVVPTVEDDGGDPAEHR